VSAGTVRCTISAAATAETDCRQTPQPRRGIPFGQKTRPCADPEIIAALMLMINQAREVFG